MSEAKAATEDRVRERAYHLWEQAGCPEGRSTEFWCQAVSEVGTDEIKPIAGDFEIQNEDPSLKAA
ncbi:DUF2934 domain-containing protein [Acidiphilium acidophilum]|uniref:DUF2934 domain-containing protein n=1 Tax=Acidiphilium acidophilum TaxID=76588 RepID=UPI002E8E7814|nr:DUF2934 domain-containing protein [Acidiphilium acidophilum]